MTHTELNDSEALVATLARAAQGSVGEPLDIEVLVAYHRNELPPEEAERVQDHLVGCPRSAQTLLDLSSFESDASRDSDAVTDLSAVAAWRSFKPRITTANDDEGDRAKPRSVWNARSPLVAIAASLLMAVVGLSLWVAQLRGTNSGLEQTVAQLSQVQVNPPVFYLDETTRDADSDVAAEVAANHPFFLVTVIPGSTEDFPAYEAEVENAAGQVIWNQTIALTDAATLRLMLPRQDFPAGDYQVRLFGRDGERKELLNDGTLNLRYR
ncbi:MAG: zf-HC2 domain-containing protein [Acidobacteriota bacterium]